MKNILKLNSQYRANVVAQAICFIINCVLFSIYYEPLYIWMCISTITFIGVISSQPKQKFWDTNLLHHLLFVLIFYILATISYDISAAYFILIIIFTYIFYILKDSGYDKSLTIWTLIQAIMFLSSTNQISLTNKILGTGIAFIEAQTIIFICFRLFPTDIEYIAEPKLADIKKISLDEWINPKHSKVRLAIRGTLVTAVLYFVCIYFVSNDLRPNWAIITAISALLRDDDQGGWHTLISGVIGSFFGFIMSYVVIKLNIYAPHLIPIILWLSLLTAIIFMFEYMITKTYTTQILGISFTIVATISAYAVLDLNSKFYLHLRLINNLLGIAFSFCALCIWIGVKKIYLREETR